MNLLNVIYMSLLSSSKQKCYMYIIYIIASFSINFKMEHCGEYHMTSHWLLIVTRASNFGQWSIPQRVDK